MNRMKLLTICIASTAFGVRHARPDVVYFTKGYFLEAKVVDKGDQWLLVPIEDARFRLPKPKQVRKSEVARIVSEKDFRDGLIAKLTALKLDDVEGRQALVKWCHDEHVTSCAKEAARSALEATKREAQAEATADAYAKAGAWAGGVPQRYYLPRQEAVELCQAALAIDPEHEGAHQALKHKKLDGRWVTAKEYSQASRSSAKRTRKRRRKQEDEQPAELWRTALAGDLPFGRGLEDVVKTWGEPASRSRRSGRGRDGAEVGLAQLTYREAQFETRLWFRDDELSGIEVTTQGADDPDDSTFCLDGERMSGKERAKAVKRILAERRVAFGMTPEEAQAVMGQPRHQSSRDTSGGADPNARWTYHVGSKILRLGFRDGRLSSICIRKRRRR